jgi:hypothetical protein
MKLSHFMKVAMMVLAIAFLGVTADAAAESDKGPFVVMIGTPASGKSVHSELISKTYGIPWINVREVLLREV